MSRADLQRLDASRHSAARAEAQRKADLTGLDHGVFYNSLTQDYFVRTLPKVRLRCGPDLTCECVYPTELAKTQEGHGPTAKAGR